MSESSLTHQEAAALQDLEKLSADRARAESEVEQTYRARRQAEEKAFQDALQRLTTTAKSETDAIQAKYQATRAGLVKQFDAERQAAQNEYDEVRQKTAARSVSGRRAAKKAHEDARWNAAAIHEAGKDGVIKRNKQREGEAASAAEAIQVIRDGSVTTVVLCRKYAPPDAGEVTVEGLPPVDDDPMPALQETLKAAGDQLGALDKLGLPKFLEWSRFVWPFLLIAAGVGVPLGPRVGWPVGIGAGVVLAIALAVGIRVWLTSIARRRMARLYPPFRQSLARAEALFQQYQQWAKATFEREKAEIEQRRERELKNADDRLARTLAEIEQRREREAKEAEETHPARIEDIQRRREDALEQIDEKFTRRLAELKERSEQETKHLHETFRQRKEATQRQHEDAWNAMADRWKQGLARVQATVGEVREQSSHWFLDWHRVSPEEWSYPTAIPPDLRFGEFEVDLARIPYGVPHDERLRPFAPPPFTLPALTPFPTHGSVLIKASDASKAEAARLLQSLMLRYATSIPPGKVRFTIIDPVGLGENFAAFMHLGDYSELLITSRIWTETPHIEQRLSDLSAHMENVIQKYLRNEFSTIEEYNIHAGEVAEPFRVLVVANFPVNFSESAARRLASIASSGTRCGVYTLISVDMKQQLPAGVQLKDLEPYCLNLTWKEGRFQWRSPEFGRYPLKLDAPPEPDVFTRLMHDVGQKAKDAHRVEVPFEYTAPAPEEYWTADSSSGISVPLGRAGATKLQYLKLGKGTSQHVLIAGKTGSGKSTLLHALIVNAALRYSPDEVELYLIDFKKGVEFKVYAALELPHAKVIAVESEREFGLSVLQRLDVELKLRGERFRDLGVQDLNGYRQLDGVPPLPRILLIVDEFQEFFVEDDKIAQDVALLLDRMVRQGRAFGIHVHLGSQSLGGAYSLARSTLGQMAVRIALQCSESDAHLILSEDNSAARLLTRPGEAIYNDQNGLVEGNNFFQVVWLSDEKREDYLGQLQELARARHRPPVSPIVFEGNQPAIVAKNHLLTGLLLAARWPEEPKADIAWLGDPIAIKDPTAATFRPQSGGNLLIIGQKDVAALGMMTTALVSIAAQHAPTDPAIQAGGVRFYLFDGSQVDAPNAGRLGQLADVVPHPVTDVTWRELAGVMTELAAEVERRQKGETGESGPIYLFLYDLQRFRDLRKSEDDFGFSRYGEEKEAPPSKHFTTILRDGPPVGVHAIVWCDSLNNLNRTFDRQTLREFEIRVLFQMSANDSSTLIDNPAAGRLGENRALYFSEEEGRMEKFRPYGLPTDEWLGWVREQFSRRLAPVGQNSHKEHAAEATETAGA